MYGPFGIGLRAGGITLQSITREHGLITNMIVGVNVALPGSIAARPLDMKFGGLLGGLMTAALGSTIFLLGLAVLEIGPWAIQQVAALTEC